MNFIALDEKTRKALFKLVSEKELKHLAKKNKNEKQYLRKFKKSIEKITISEIYKYVEENNLDKYVKENDSDQEDPIIVDFCTLLGGKIIDKFKNALKVCSIINNSEYEKLDGEQKEKIEEFREEFEKSDLPITLDDFVKINCLPDQQTITTIIINKAVGTISKEKENLENELIKIKKQLFDLKTDFNSLNKEKKNIESKNKENEKKLEKINKKYSLDNATIKINKLLKTNFENKTYSELFVELDDLEKELLSKGKYDDILDVLAAKYAITKIQKEEK